MVLVDVSLENYLIIFQFVFSSFLLRDLIITAKGSRQAGSGGAKRG